MKRGLFIALIAAAIISVILSLFPALRMAQALLMEFFIIVLATAVLYGIGTLFYRSVMFMGEESEKRAHGFFMFLGFLTIPFLLLISRSSTHFVKQELLFSYPAIIPSIVTLEMEKHPYLVKMPLKKVAIIVVSQMTNNSWIPPLSLLEDAHLSSQELREMVPQRGAKPNRTNIEKVFSNGDARLFMDTAKKVSKTLDQVAYCLIKPPSERHICREFDNSPQTHAIYTQVLSYDISSLHAIVNMLMRTIIYPLQTSFFALLLLYVVISFITFGKGKKSVTILFFTAVTVTLLTQMPWHYSPAVHSFLEIAEYLLLIPTISVFRAVLLSSGVAFIVYLFFVLSVIVRGRKNEK